MVLTCTCNYIKDTNTKGLQIPPPDKTGGKSRFTLQTLPVHYRFRHHPYTGKHSLPIPYLLIRYRNAQCPHESIPHRTLTKHTLNPPALPPWGESSVSGREFPMPLARQLQRLRREPAAYIYMCITSRLFWSRSRSSKQGSGIYVRRSG